MRPVYPFDDAVTARAVVDDRGVLVEWNEGARRLLGWTPGEVLGSPAAHLLAGDPRPDFPRERRWDGTLTLRHRDGRAVTVWVLANRRSPEEGGGLFLVTPLENDAPRDPDDPLSRIDLMQSPCATAVYDERLRLHGMNAAMAEVFGGMPAERLRGLRHSEIGGHRQSEDFERHMHRVLTTGREDDVRTYVPIGVDGRAHAWLARMSPVTDPQGRVRGVCVAVHDFTEQYQARERLQLVNEASVRIGTTLDVTRTAQELADVCVPALADFVGVDLLDTAAYDNKSSTGPPPMPVALRRAAHTSITPGTPEAVLAVGRTEVYPATSPQGASLVTQHSVVLSEETGDLDKWLSWDPVRSLRVRELGVHSTMSVPIRARGVTLGVAVFVRFERPGSFTPDDVLLAEEVTAHAAVCIDNAQRYSRERETALALQRSLLPRTLPRTAAVEAASRYLPAVRGGTGGDWFDVIPLSGMRVALVVGDVFGRGVQASAIMGSLRTAVRTLADIDLAPEELLTHLDDVVARMSAGGEDGPGEISASCLYAVYDPLSRRCTLARAGHPSPVLLPPDGPPRRVELPWGPPLGVGGLPFESVELVLPEDSVLAFFTDGLLEGRERDVDTGHRLLCEALAARSGSLEETCDHILRTLLPADGAYDDAALLLARTRGLPSSQVATWEVPTDPSLVAPVRRQVVEQLGVWGLDEAAFTTELVVSELVTNALRYGTPPIRLRLIHNGTHLICEVYDTTHAAPHLRRAKTWDEGGRGLLLVAQLTRRWGSRQTTEGKTIWAELSLRDEG